MSDGLRWLLISIGSFIVIVAIVVIAIVLKKKSKIKEETEFPQLLEALGGAENISNVKLNGSRISLNFDNKRNIDKEKIKDNGVETIVVSNKKITLVIGKKAQSIYKYLQGSVN